MCRVKRSTEWRLSFYENGRFYFIKYRANYKKDVIRYLQTNYPYFARCYAYNVNTDEFWNVNNDRFIVVKRATMNRTQREIRKQLIELE